MSEKVNNNAEELLMDQEKVSTEKEKTGEELTEKVKQIDEPDNSSEKSDKPVDSINNESENNPTGDSEENALKGSLQKKVIEGQAEERELIKKIGGDEGDNETVDTSVAVPKSIGFLVITIVFGFLIGWSYLAPLESAAYAPGFVTVESYRKTIQHLEGGIVKEIQTKDGELVNKGDILIVIDDTQLKAQLEILDAQYIASLALSARLEAERDGLTKIKFSQYLNERKDDDEVKDVMRIQKQVFNSRKAAREGEIEVLKQRIEQLREQINGLREQQKSNKKQIGLYNEEIVEFKALLKQGYTDKTRMREMERRVAELEGELANNGSTIGASKIKMGETKLEILQIENRHQLEVAEQLSQTVTKINDLEERRLAIQDKLTRTKIVAQDSGMVLGMTVHTIGGVIAPGKPILELVPQGENLIIEAQVSPVDIDRVHTGLISEVRFSAFNSATTPVIDGEVISVSADSLTDANTGMPYYLARIRVTPEGYENLGDLKLLPGMPADTLIKTGERTLFEYLIKPITNAFARSFKED